MSERDPRYVAALALAAGLILIIGTWLKPTQQRAETIVLTGAPVASQAERARLDRLAQKGQLEQMAAYFSQIAFGVASQLVRLDLGVTGVIWNSTGLVITARLGERFPAKVAVEADASPVSSRTISAPPTLPAAVVRLGDGVSVNPVERSPTVDDQTGEWLVAVWRTPDRHYSFAPGLHLGVSDAACGDYRFDELTLSVPVTATMAGGGIFDQDARLLAIVLRCDDRYVAMTVRSIEATIAEATSLEGHLLTRYGLGVRLPHEIEREHVEAGSGVLVEEVWKGYPAEDAGLRPGDLVHRLGDDPVESVDDLSPLVAAAAPLFQLAIVRDGGEVAATLPGPLLSPAASSVSHGGLGFEPVSTGFRIEYISPGSPADSAGLRSGDRLLAINGQTPRSLEQVRRVLEDPATPGSFVTLQRGARVWGVLLQ